MESKTREIYRDNFTEYVLCLALDVGEGMLKNGGEVARVEDTIERICRAYGAVHVEVFTIISMINAAIRMPDGSYSSQLRRVKQTGNNLGMLERLNALSREICATTPELDVFDMKLRELKRERPYPLSVQIAASAIGAAMFCLFFGGGLLDSLITLVIGVVISLIMNFSSPRLNQMAKTVVSSFVAALLAGAVNMLSPLVNVDSIIIGAIMLLVPGLVFGTAMRDLLCGDLVAGALKILQAVLQTLMIGFGYMLAYALLGNNLLPTPTETGGEYLAVQLITAVMSSVAFAVVFKTHKRHLITVAACGLLTFASYYFVDVMASSLFWAAFISSAVAALFSEIVARVRKMPAVVVLMPSVISTVPGGYLYRAARDFTYGSTATAWSHLAAAAAVALGIAGGIVVVTMLFGLVKDKLTKNKENKVKCKETLTNT